MWVRGLCEQCNNLAGIAHDRAYADFATQVARFTTPSALRLAVYNEPPGAQFAPGLVARSVLFGMFAINPRLRILFPDFAHDLRHEVPGRGPIRWPDQLQLKVGRTHPRFERQGLLVSGIWSMRVLVQRVRHSSFGDIVFRPLVWCLMPATADNEEQLGPEVTRDLADATEWIRYGPDRTSVDLRNLTRTFPTFAHPMHTKHDDWVEMLDASDGSTGDGPVVVFGRIP